MNILKSFILLVLLPIQLVAHNDYSIENNGYLVNPGSSSLGIIATDNYASSLYLINKDNISIIHSSPGCGRYFQIAPNGKDIGFKFIQDDGLQAPAILNLEDLSVNMLHPPVELCGQVSFFNGGCAYTIGTQLVIQPANGKRNYIELEEYVNIISSSVSGNQIAYCNIEGKLKLVDVHGGRIIVPQKDNCHFVYPKFSPDGKQILLQSGEEIYTHNIKQNSFHKIAKGVSPAWSLDSKQIIFTVEKREDQKLMNSDISLYDFKSKNIIPLTRTEGVMEMQPSFASNSEIIYHTYKGKEIIIGKVDVDQNEISNQKVFKRSNKLPIKHHKVKKFLKKAEVMLPNEVPYIHQVYDTRNEHYGYGSCAPTTCIMGLAYYNLLPPWPTEVDNGIGNHINDYGSYVSQKYRYNENYFEAPATTSGGDIAYGGYGYMWGNGSPNSTQRNYIELHGLESDQLWTYNCTFEDTQNEIDAGYVHPICSYLTTSGHLTLAIGYVEGQHTLIFSDPYGDKNTPNYPSYDGQKVYYDWPGFNNGYQNLDANGTYGYVPWTTKQRGLEISYNDTIIDDIFYKHGFYINNSENNSHQRYYRDALAGYNNHLWYTITMDAGEDVCWVTWTPSISEASLYDVKAYIPAEYANAKNALYKIHHKYGTSNIRFNQNEYNGQWLNLGRYHVSADDTCVVQLGDETGVAGQEIAFDAIKWEKASLSSIAAGFHVSNNKVFEGSTITFHNSSIGADSYEWMFEGGSPQTSTNIHPEVSYAQKGFYDVKLIAHSGILHDTLLLENFIEVYNDEGVADLSKNNQVFVYPNPCKEYAFVTINSADIGDYLIYLYASDGKQILKVEGSKQSALPTKHAINTKTLKGNYILKIAFKNKEYQTKLLAR